MVFKVENMSNEALQSLLDYWYTRIAPISRTAVQQIVELEIELEGRCGK